MTHMSEHATKILVIDDEPGIHRSLNLLFRSDFSVHAAFSGEDGLEKVDAVSPDLILLDLMMPRMTGMAVLRNLRENDMDIPVIVFTAHGSINSAVQSIKLGAIDYIEKPFDNGKLKEMVDVILERRGNSRKLSRHKFIVGESPQIQKVWQSIEKYGPTDLPILIQGETGTGKELFAKAIHEMSKRKHEAFVPVDCSTVPETLFESEIFGYEKGAFTGANARKPGQLDWAHEGTFFLDEIHNLSLSYQAKLLRVIQERQYVPLGAREAKVVDVRFVSSSNVGLREAVERDTFREDLYYRISGVCIKLPPLREREGDIELLAHHFASKYAAKYNRPAIRISDEAIGILVSYLWPGNVRQLEHTIGAAVASEGRVILPGHLPSEFREGTLIPRKSGNDNGKVEFGLNFSCDVTQPIDLKEFKRRIAAEAERSVIAEVRRRSLLTQTELAKFLSLDPKTLRAKVKRV